MIPTIDAAAMLRGEPETLESVRVCAEETGFMIVEGTAITPAQVRKVIAAYRAFFHRPEAEKDAVNMVRTGSNRGWGPAKSEQVNPEANPDFKEVFDCGFALPPGDTQAHLSVYAPNLWPAKPAGFRDTIEGYYAQALRVSLDILHAVAQVIGAPPDYFDDKFDRPMALLRGNFYPQRPDWAGARDFGIAAHTDYGCLTLLAMDGTPGLEVRKRGGGWIPVCAPVGEFVINFGEMLEMWTDKRVVATPHRVVGGSHERLSIPLFYNPNADTNVAPVGSGRVIRAMDHLQKRYDDTYLHLQGQDG